MALTGKAALALVVGLIPVLMWPSGLVVLAWTVLVSLAVMVDLALAKAPATLRVTRAKLAPVRLTQTAVSSVRVVNPTSGPVRLVLRDAWPPSVGAAQERPRLVIPAGESRTVRTQLQPHRRGRRQAGPVTLRSFGPLGLAAWQLSFLAPAELEVLPAFRSRVHLPQRLARLREMDGAASVNVRGQGTEFDSLRDYQVGDDVRSIDWRATARAEKVMIRTWRPERDRRVVIILDCSRWSAGRVGDETRLDAAVEAALLLGALASAGGDRVELIAYDRVMRARTSASAGRADLGRLSQALADVDPSLVEADWPGVVAEVARATRQRALVVLLTSTEPALVEDGLGQVLTSLTARHAVLIGTVRDPDEATAQTGVSSAAQAYVAAAAARHDLALQAMEQSLTRLGASVVAATEQLLAPAVADAYLQLKAAGRL